MGKWRRTAACLLVSALLVLTAGAAGGHQNPASEELRAVWVASIYHLDYPSGPTTDPAILKQQADEILQGCVDMGMNAVILQVRPSCDALYPSKLFPWSRYLSGTQGVAPADGFDPLAYWLEQAHELGLELHAWLNPFRVTKGGAEELASLSADSPAVLHPEWLVEYKENYYLDPGVPEVRELVIQGAEELVRNYDLDGIHLDDYFYPSTDFDDGDTYERYGQFFAEREDWRRDNVNLLVRDMGARLHAINPELSYGISPAGVWANRTSHPQGSDTNGHQTYFSAYADSRRWVKEGWVDYICPQLYWQIGHKSADYKTLALWWADVVRGTDVKLYIGMADYLSNDNRDSVWYGVEALEQQLTLNDTLPEVAGEVHFRYRLMADKPAVRVLYQGWYMDTAEPPALPEEGPVETPPVEEPERPRLDSGSTGAYIQGSGGQFRPDAPLSRAEAVALLARLSVDGTGSPLFDGKAGYEMAFTDVRPDVWYAPYVGFASRYGVVNGYTDGTFRPDAPVSRAELVQLLSAYFQPEPAEGAVFSDVPERYWAADAIAHAAGSGWISGYADGTFQPGRAVTRAEAVRIINGALGRGGSAPEGGALFSDVPETHWAYGHIMAAAGL